MTKKRDNMSTSWISVWQEERAEVIKSRARLVQIQNGRQPGGIEEHNPRAFSAN